MRCLTHRHVSTRVYSRGTLCRHTRLPSSRAAMTKGHTVGRKLRITRCAEVSGSSVIKKLNAVELEAALEDRTLPTVIDFYATWCGPCLMMAKELEKVAETLKGKVRILKVDTDEENHLSTALKIEGLPTLMFFSPNINKTPLRVEGFLPADIVINIINEKL